MTQRREFLQLAKTYRPTKDKIAGWYLSEKLDGTRCLWDGGISRGRDTASIPWASVTNPRTLEPKGKVKPVSTGLWSRYGNPIMAPDAFLNKLPPFACDGELWAGRGSFQLCRSICGRDEPDERFMDVMKFAVFSNPPIDALFRTGLIKNTNMLVDLDYTKVIKWASKNKINPLGSPEGSTLSQELFAMLGWEGWDEQVFMLKQIILNHDEDIACAELTKHMDTMLDNGAEGIMLRDPLAKWTPKRISGCLKFKPWEDDEGTVVGFTSGRKTNKGSKLLGMIGALILDYNGKRLELSGLTDEERQFSTRTYVAIAVLNPGEDMPEGTQGKHFKLGDKVTFKYRELSDDGVPKEARYWRRRDVE